MRNSWGQTIIDADEASVLANDDLFLQFIKGIHIRTENPFQNNEEGGIFYFDMEDANSRVTLYYHIAGDTTPKEFELLINDDCARYTRAYHNYNFSNAGLALAYTSINEYAYVQALSGLKTVIHFPHIKTLADSQMVGLNKAELILPVDYYIGSAQSQLVNSC